MKLFWHDPEIQPPSLCVPPLTAAMLGLCRFSQARPLWSQLLPSYLVTALTVACALFMENLNSTVIATSLPAIAKDLHEDPISLKLALTSYLISLAIFIPASGWAADRFGARTISGPPSLSSS